MNYSDKYNRINYIVDKLNAFYGKKVYRVYWNPNYRKYCLSSYLEGEEMIVSGFEHVVAFLELKARDWKL